VKLSDMPKFEKQNQTISICILAVDERGVIVPWYVTKYNKCDGPFRKHQYQVDLLMIEDDNGWQYYTLIHSITRLLSRFASYKRKMHYCKYCLHGFWSVGSFRSHILNCKSHEPCRIIFPSRLSKNEKE